MAGRRLWRQRQPAHWPLAASEDFLVCGLIGLVLGAAVFGRDKTHTEWPPLRAAAHLPSRCYALIRRKALLAHLAAHATPLS